MKSSFFVEKLGEKMNNKELKKLNRKELLELLLEQTEKVTTLENELNSKRIRIKNSGNLATASIKISGILELAQTLADDYVRNVKANCHEMEMQTKKKCLLKIKETENYCQKLKQESLNKKMKITIKEVSKC